jgi:hypothetical protein
MKRDDLLKQISEGLGITVQEEDIFLENEETGDLSMVRGGATMWFIDRARVNINDLIAPRRAGKIVRCDGNPNECVKIYRAPTTDSSGGDNGGSK